MRDIRSDLQERATLIDQQIKGAYDRFERSIRQLQDERDARISELQSAVSMIAKFIEFEDRICPMGGKRVSFFPAGRAPVEIAIAASPSVVDESFFILVS